MFDYLKDLLYAPQKAELDPESLPEDFRELAMGMLYFGQCVNEVREYTKSISQGDLDNVPLAQGNELASGLKSLNASLKHLTWQMQQIAKGDYSQHVSFMGDFSAAVNDMVAQLDERQRRLMDQIEQNERKNEALLQSNSMFEAITDSISQLIVMVDRNTGEWLFNNHDVAATLLSMDTEAQLRAWIAEHSKLGTEHFGHKYNDLELVDIHGHVQYLSIGNYIISWHGHDAIAFVFTDVSAERERLTSLENIAYQDAMTNTFNRHYGMGVLNDWLETGETFIICFVDMDNLKFVNDQFGHAEGDGYILNVTATLKRFSENSIICRLGGDEFMLLCKDWSLEDAEARLETLRSELMANNDKQAQYKQSLSYGVIYVDKTNTKPASELLTIADEKMYHYKRAHKAERRG